MNDTGPVTLFRTLGEKLVKDFLQWFINDALLGVLERRHWSYLLVHKITHVLWCRHYSSKSIFRESLLNGTQDCIYPFVDKTRRVPLTSDDVSGSAYRSLCLSIPFQWVSMKPSRKSNLAALFVPSYSHDHLITVIHKCSTIIVDLLHNLAQNRLYMGKITSIIPPTQWHL